MLQPDTLINQRYQIVGQVGKGGMGAVYEAIDTRLRHRVALKQMLITDPQYAHAFEHEAILLANLRHGSLPRVTDHFSDTDGQFLVMDFIPGADLATLLQHHGSPFPLARVLAWADQLLILLEYLHCQQPPILHRDIKPQNLKVTADDMLILLDFGLAKGTFWQTQLTSGKSIGGYSVAYAPLEQIQGTGTEVRSDLYAVGATLYHLLVGAPPPDALTRVSCLVNQQPDPLRLPHERNPAISRAVSAALGQALSIQINARPVSASSLRAALRVVSPTSAGTPSPDAPTQVIQPGVYQSPFAVGTPTIAVRPPRPIPEPPPFVSPPPRTPARPRSKRWPFPLLALSILILSILLGYGLIAQFRQAQEKSLQATAMMIRATDVAQQATEAAITRKTATAVAQAATSTAIAQATATAIAQAATSTAIAQAATSTAIAQAATSTAIARAATSTAIAQAATSTAIAQAATSTAIAQATATVQAWRAGSGYIPSIDSRVVGLSLFEGGKSTLAEDRVYATTFRARSARFIWWKLQFERPYSEQAQSFQIRSVYYRADGTVMSDSTRDFEIPQGWHGVNEYSGSGWETPGSWKLGQYTVRLYIDGNEIARSTFTITN